MSSTRTATSARPGGSGQTPGGAGQDEVAAPRGGLRAPCPCGSGKRYKQCHGRGRGADAFVARPFEGLPRETDWVALRELVPAATLRTRTTDGDVVTFATVLPMAWPALRREDGTVLVGIQTAGASTDPSRDLAAALDAALSAAEAGPVAHIDARSAVTRLQDRLDLGDTPTLTVHQGFDFWLEGLDGEGTAGEAGDEASDGGSPQGREERLAAMAPQVRASLERANEAVVPTSPITSVPSAYWARIGETAHVRWVITEPEDRFIDALARLHARRDDDEPASAFGAGTRYAGSFRAHGLVVPVWDVDPESSVEALEEPMAAFADRLAEAMAETAPLTGEQRRAKAGLVSRQITLR